MTRVAAWLVRLLDRPALRNVTLQPEQRLQVEVADALRAASLEGRLRANWTAIPQELPLPGTVQRMAAMIGIKRKAMGCLPGSPDLVFTWRNGGGWIELKRPAGQQLRMAVTNGTLKAAKPAKGSLSPGQRDFRQWIDQHTCRHAVCTSAKEVLGVLYRWGILDLEGDDLANHPDQIGPQLVDGDAAGDHR
jgi:hypothetical protein